MMIMEKALEAVGLTKVEAKVYVTLLDLGAALAGTISRKSGIHRRCVYDVMERLIEKGLASYIKQNERRYYQATDPARLLELAKEKEMTISEILPTLQIKYKTSRQKQETNFYRGKEGIKTIFEDQIMVGDEILIIGGARNAPEIIKYYIPKYTKKRLEKKIRLKILFCGVRKAEKIPLAEIRYLPEGYGSFAATNIYGSKVAIILWTENPFAILIEEKEIAEGYRNFFKFLWEHAKKGNEHRPMQ